MANQHIVRKEISVFDWPCRCQPLPHFPHARDNLLLPSGLRNDDIGEPGSGAILATHNPNIDPELNKYNKDRITQDAGCGGALVYTKLRPVFCRSIPV